MIYRENKKEERDFKTEYKDAHKEYLKAEEEERKEKIEKWSKKAKIIGSVVALIFLCVFLGIGGIQLEQKVVIEEGYVAFLDNDFLEFDVEKNYKKSYIPFILSRTGSKKLMYQNQYMNLLPVHNERNYQFRLEKYECFEGNKKVQCHNIEDLEKMEKGKQSEISYERRNIPTDSFDMRIYQGTCNFDQGKVYSGKVISDISKYIDSRYHYCILLSKKEDKTTKTEIRIKFSFEDLEKNYSR